MTPQTLGGHVWLRPDPACRAIIDGVFGKALALYTAVRLYAYAAPSNHLHYLCSADDDPDQLPLFIDYVHGNIARQLNALRDREGVFWSRRGSVIAVLDGDAQIDRLRCILAQGPASNLVASPRDWPGACSTPALLGDMTIPAVYRSLDERRRNARRSNPRPEAELAHDVAITLTPLPVWADLDAAALRAKHAALVADIEAEHAGAIVLGAAHLIAEDPDATPATKLEPSPAPACHAFCARVRARFLAAYATFRDRYRDRRRDHRQLPARRARPPPLVRRHPHRPRRHLAPRRRRRRPGARLRAARTPLRWRATLPAPIARCPACQESPLAGRAAVLSAGDAREIRRRDSPSITPYVRSDGLRDPIGCDSVLGA